MFVVLHKERKSKMARTVTLTLEFVACAGASDSEIVRPIFSALKDLRESDHPILDVRLLEATGCLGVRFYPDGKHEEIREFEGRDD